MNYTFFCNTKISRSTVSLSSGLSRKRGGSGDPGFPAFLAIFVERTTFNTCRFCRVSVMTDQNPGLRIRKAQSGSRIPQRKLGRTSVVKHSFRPA